MVHSNGPIENYRNLFLVLTHQIIFLIASKLFSLNSWPMFSSPSFWSHILYLKILAQSLTQKFTFGNLDYVADAAVVNSNATKML